ncbi:hypothetical protein DD563_14465 [Pelagicola sp. LXJ1103]|nr:hypothetical protein DD563_14465 [Pelagicola sp. LXJ1103]
MSACIAKLYYCPVPALTDRYVLDLAKLVGEGFAQAIIIRLIRCFPDQLFATRDIFKATFV